MGTSGESLMDAAIAGDALEVLTEAFEKRLGLFLPPALSSKSKIKALFGVPSVIAFSLISVHQRIPKKYVIPRTSGGNAFSDLSFCIRNCQ